jgi:hypothetical protein
LRPIDLRPEMTALPFSLSPDAAEWVSREIRNGKVAPHIIGLVPVLFRHWQFPARQDEHGKIEYIYDPCFEVEWYPPEDATTLQEIELCGSAVLIDDDDLEVLKNKRLVVESVDSGMPGLPDLQLLRAIDDHTRPRP